MNSKISLIAALGVSAYAQQQPYTLDITVAEIGSVIEGLLMGALTEEAPDIAGCITDSYSIGTNIYEAIEDF